MQRGDTLYKSADSMFILDFMASAEYSLINNLKLKFHCTLLKEFLGKSLVIELLLTLLVEDKVNIRILSSMNDKIGPGRYF